MKDVILSQGQIISIWPVNFFCFCFIVACNFFSMKTVMKSHEIQAVGGIIFGDFV